MNLNSHTFGFRRSSLSTFLLFALLVINAQVLAPYGNNPFGIYGAQESFFAFLILFSTAYVVFKKRVTPIEWYVFSMAIFAVLASAFLSKMRYGQPMYFGVMEARRIFAVLSFFPIVFILRNFHVSVDQFLRAVCYSSFLCVLLTIGASQADLSSAQVLSESAFERSGVGGAFIGLGFLVFLYRWKERNSVAYLASAILLLLVLVFVVQSRQIYVAAVISGFMLLGVGRVSLLLLFLVVVVLYVGLDASNSYSILNDRAPRLARLVSQDSDFSLSARARGYETILYEFKNNGWLYGRGGLYQGWNGGFSRYFGYFYLSDLGIVGSVFRFGILIIPVYGLYLLFQLGHILRQRATNLRVLQISMLLYLSVMAPTSAPIEIRGHIVAILLALSYAVFLSHPITPRAMLRQSNQGKVGEPTVGRQ